jgi:hypothetical protein
MPRTKLVSKLPAFDGGNHVLFDEQDPSISGGCSRRLTRSSAVRYQGNLAAGVYVLDKLLKPFPPRVGIYREGRSGQSGRSLPVMNNSTRRSAKPTCDLNSAGHAGLVERILEADRITREMIEAQQQRLNSPAAINAPRNNRWSKRKAARWMPVFSCSDGQR